MHSDTKTTITAICRADGTIPAELIDKAIKVLSGQVNLQEDNNATPDKIISRAEAAKILGVSIKTIDFYSDKDYIRRVYVKPGATRATGILESSVRAILERAKA